MEWNMHESVMQRLACLVQQREAFEARYDSRAAEFLPALPALFSLHYRLTFDLEVTPDTRQLASSIAVYIAEAHDFCGESNRGVEGLIDDLWLAYRGFQRMAQRMPMDALQRYWRSDLPFFEVLERCRNLDGIETHVPSKVLERLRMFLG